MSMKWEIHSLDKYLCFLSLKSIGHVVGKQLWTKYSKIICFLRERQTIKKGENIMAGRAKRFEEREWWGYRRLCSFCRGSLKPSVIRKCGAEAAKKPAWCVWAAVRTRVAGAEWVEGRGVEGDEAEKPWGQVLTSLVALYKNQNLTLREIGHHWGTGYVTNGIGLKL